MIPPSFIRIFSTFLLGFLLSSCIDSKEEIWLNKDGSGKAKISIFVPNAVVALRGGKEGISNLVDKLLSEESSVSNVTTTFTATGKQTKIETSFRFSSATKLYESLDRSASDSDVPGAFRHIIGTTSIERSGLGVSGERKMNFGKAIPGIGFFSAGGKNNQLVTIVHLPFKPSAHNATRTENNGSTLIWEIALSEAMKAPHSQRLSYQLSATPVILGVAGIGLGVFFLYRTRRKAKKRRSAQLDELRVD